MLTEKQINDKVVMHKVLANSARLKIVLLLRAHNGEMLTRHIIKNTKKLKASISTHLSILETAGIVMQTRACDNSLDKLVKLTRLGWSIEL